MVILEWVDVAAAAAAATVVVLVVVEFMRVTIEAVCPMA